MADTTELENDSDGNVVTKPIIGWSVGTAAEVSVLLVIEYVEDLQQMESGDSRTIPFTLLPLQCLELAEALIKASKKLLESLPPTQKAG